MKGIILQPTIADENVIVQFTQNVAIDKSMEVRVPNGYQAIAFIDEKVAFRVNAGADKKLITYGKEYLGRQCRIAFVRMKLLPAMMWGFGNIQVNNERLKEAYRVGANGKYTIEISEVAKLINAFNLETSITIDAIREKTISVLRNLGNDVLGKYFAQTDISVFEIASKIGDVRSDLFNALKDEVAFREIGVKLKDLTVEKIHVNEEDLELIRNRINDIVEHKEEASRSDLKVEFAHLKSELSEMVSSELRQSEQRTKKENLASVKAELEKHSEEISRSFYEQVQKQLNDFGESISAEIEDMITERLPLREEAKEENVQKIKLSARMLLEQSDEKDDLVVLAGMIYSKVEENLIFKYKLPHKNEKFYMDYGEYLKAVREARAGERYFLMERDKNGILKPIPPRVIECNRDGTPLAVEMHPIIRFMKAGLTPPEAKKAADMWRVINKIRHKSEENKRKLEEFFKRYKPRKEYMKDVLDFYQDKWLYTED